MSFAIKLFLKSSLLLCFSILSCGVFSSVDSAQDYSPYPNPDSGYVSDLANLLTKAEEERIEQWLWQVESRTQIEIIVITVDSIKNYSGTSNESIERFSTGIFDQYGIGNKPKNDGVLLLVAKGDRKARIELGAGYGSVRNADANRIMQNVIIPKFKKNDYAGGVTDGTEAIIKEFANMRVGFPWFIVGIVVAAIVSFIIGISLIKSGKRGWGYVFIGIAILLVLLAIFLLIRIMQHMPKNDSGSWGSGGLGGFGGGSSGGGGATGSW